MPTLSALCEKAHCSMLNLSIVRSDHLYLGASICAFDDVIEL